MNNNNYLGPIANSYSELQSLVKLFSANDARPKPEVASNDEVIRCCWQSIEISVINIEYIFSTINRGAISQSLKIEDLVCWLPPFAQLILKIQDVSYLMSQPNAKLVIGLRDSQNFQSLVSQQEIFFLSYSQTDLDELIGNGISSKILDYLHFFKEFTNNQNTIGDFKSYEDMALPNKIREAVFDFDLSVPTYLMQFRAIHQISELFARTINKHIEQITSEKSTCQLDLSAFFKIVVA